MCSTQFIFILLSFYYFLSILRKKILVSWWLGLGAIDAPKHRIQNTYQWAIMAIFYHSIMLTTNSNSREGTGQHYVNWKYCCALKFLSVNIFMEAAGITVDRCAFGPLRNLSVGLSGFAIMLGIRSTLTKQNTQRTISWRHHLQINKN